VKRQIITRKTRRRKPKMLERMITRRVVSEERGMVECLSG